MSLAICEYDNHRVEGVECSGALYVYIDKTNGIEVEIKICKEHLFDHVHKYYPGCANEKNLLSLYPQLAARLTPDQADGDTWLCKKCESPNDRYLAACTFCGTPRRLS